MVRLAPEGEATVVVTREALAPNAIEYINLSSVFYGERLLTTANPDTGRDRRLLERLGMSVEPVRTGH